MAERDMEQVIRAGLERRAAEADVTAPVAARARAEVDRRRRSRGGVGAAAAAVLLIVGGVAATTRGGPDDATKPPLGGNATTAHTPVDVGGWRTEYWQEVAVDVPVDWGYGGAPIESEGDAVACYPEATVGPDGNRLARPGERGWVGRPIALTDVCALYPWIEHSPQEEPTQPYVWLGAAVAPGVVEYGNGYVQETVEVEGVMVTVASDQPALRERVLASARAEHICPPAGDTVPEGKRENTTEGHGSFREGSVCAYRRTESGFALTYAATLDEAAITATWAALDEAPAVDDTLNCFPGEIVVVSALFTDSFSSQQDLLHWDAVFRTDCGTVDTGPPFFESRNKIVKQLPEMVQPWAHNGIPAVVYGPTGGKGAMIDSFIGPQG